MAGTRRGRVYSFFSTKSRERGCTNASSTGPPALIPNRQFTTFKGSLSPTTITRPSSPPSPSSSSIRSTSYKMLIPLLIHYSYYQAFVEPQTSMNQSTMRLVRPNDSSDLFTTRQIKIYKGCHSCKTISQSFRS